MAFAHGKDSTLTVNGVSITGVDSVTLSRNANPAEITSLADTDQAFLDGLRGATMSVSGSWDGAASPGNDAVLSALIGAGHTSWDYSPDGTIHYSQTAAGNTGALLTSYDISTPVADKVSFSAEFQISGVIDRA